METVWTVGAGGVLMLNGSKAPLIKGGSLFSYTHRGEL
jgi:hypothetical protein